MWQKIWGKQMNQIVERVEHITSNGKIFFKAAHISKTNYNKNN